MAKYRTNNQLKTTIVDSAQEVFSKFGLKKTTMDDIALKINKAKGAIYYYFGSKEEVYEAVLEKEASTFRDEIHLAVDAQNTAREKLKAYVITRMNLFQKLANFYTTFQREYYDNYAFIQRIRKKYDIEEQELIASILVYGNERKELILKDLALTSFAILAAMKGFEFAWSIESNPGLMESQVERLLDILFDGLRIR